MTTPMSDVAARRTVRGLAGLIEAALDGDADAPETGRAPRFTWLGKAVLRNDRHYQALLHFSRRFSHPLGRIFEGIFHFERRWRVKPDYRTSLVIMEEEYREYVLAAYELAMSIPDGLTDQNYDAAQNFRDAAAEELADLIWTAVQHGLYRGLTPDDIEAGIERVVAKNAAKTADNGYRVVEITPGVNKVTNK